MSRTVDTFSAPTVPEALARVRARLGESAVIVAVRQGARGAEVDAQRSRPRAGLRRLLEGDAGSTSRTLPPPSRAIAHRPPGPDGGFLRQLAKRHQKPDSPRVAIAGIAHERQEPDGSEYAGRRPTRAHS